MKKIACLIVLVAFAAFCIPVLAQDVAPAAAPAAAPEAAPAVAPAAPAGPPPGMKVSLPYKVYGNCEDEGESAFIPAGWMGSTDSIEFDDCWKENPQSGESCIKCTFTDPKGWGGVAWQSPANNWGDEEGGVDLTGAKQLSFWARGEKGGEMVEFKLGLINRNKPFYDTGKGSLGKIKLEATWKQFVIPLAGQNLSRIMTGFAWSTAGRAEPVTFYIDNIVYE